MESARFKECFVTKSRSKSAFLIYEYFIHSGCLLLLLLLLLLFIYFYIGTFHVMNLSIHLE